MIIVLVVAVVVIVVVIESCLFFRVKESSAFHGSGLSNIERTKRSVVEGAVGVMSVVIVKVIVSTETIAM